MRVPDEGAGDFGDFDVVVVDGGDEVGVPVGCEGGEGGWDGCWFGGWMGGQLGGGHGLVRWGKLDMAMY